MLSSASTKASVSNKMSFWWKIKVTRVQVFLSWVATKQNKGLPARAKEKRMYHHQNTWRKLTNNKWNQSFQVRWTNYWISHEKSRTKKKILLQLQKASHWKDQIPEGKKKGTWVNKTIISFIYKKISQGCSPNAIKRFFPSFFKVNCLEKLTSLKFTILKKPNLLYWN